VPVVAALGWPSAPPQATSQGGSPPPPAVGSPALADLLGIELDQAHEGLIHEGLIPAQQRGRGIEERGPQIRASAHP
jgi:hypothetical protein